ncbi:hypothetical protein LCGC14_2229670 [marine sediment metagenome]|uniref:Uncharacterized protein n=1 Tax=marine sediment metagenome TaxID=412755 RepID=A0A0F9D8T7_9ZZZZ
MVHSLAKIDTQVLIIIVIMNSNNDYSCSLTVNLFPHQYVSVEEMQAHESNYILQVDDTRIIRRVNILGDMTGMGKTLSILTLISNTLHETRCFYPERHEDHRYLQLVEQGEDLQIPGREPVLLTVGSYPYALGVGAHGLVCP